MTVYGALSTGGQFTRSWCDCSCPPLDREPRDQSAVTLERYRDVNVRRTLELADIAASSGVRRFIFLSSIAVNGRETTSQPFRAADPAAPEGPYACSKHEAERGLFELASRGPMEVVVVRPPMVYGPHAPGNFRRLVEWVRRGVPLPLGRTTTNRRGFVSIFNLVEFLQACLDHPLAANETFLVSDGEDISTHRFVTLIGGALGRPPRLVPVPVMPLRWLAERSGYGDTAQSLLGNLEIDIRKNRETIGWSPSVPLESGILRSIAGTGAPSRA